MPREVASIVKGPLPRVGRREEEEGESVDQENGAPGKMGGQRSSTGALFPRPSPAGRVVS